LLSREENGNAPAPRSAAVIYPNAKKILKRTLFYIVLTYQKPVLFSYIYPSTFKAKMIRPSNRASIRNISDYSPFGVQLAERTISGDGYRFGFQGQEGDDEIKGEGNSVNYPYRMHDPRLGRFFAVDPLASKYPWNSVYTFSENKVIHCMELEGLEAWEVNREWTDDDKKNYGINVKEFAEILKANDIERTCEDFALNCLISFAKANNLPIEITNRSGTYNASTFKGTYEEFRDKVMHSTGASDLAKNTLPISSRADASTDGANNADKKADVYSQIEESVSGDIMLMKTSNDNTHGHAQVVSGKGSGLTFIRQGSQSNSYLSSDPNHMLYSGTNIEMGQYDHTNLVYNNFTTGVVECAAGKSMGVEVRMWDFEKFNKTLE
jgi:RHS repeat-associated protein